MTKKSGSYELALSQRKPGVPAYQWLYEALRAQILSGGLRPGMRLPATRDLARQYGLARGTVVNAFELLASEGYVEGSTGSGTYVSRTLPEELLEAAREFGERPDRVPKRKLRVSDFARRLQLFPDYETCPALAFRANLPALELFPGSLWAKITNRCLRRASPSLFLGCDAMGYEPLREAIAEYLNASRGARCSPEQIAVVSGVQAALDLTSRILLNPGDRVCMENPGYPGAAMVFEAAGAKISAVPVDQEGMKLPERSLRGARLVYVTPGHQFPLGVTMSLGRRLALLEWSRKTGSFIFEDDYDSEYRYSGRPIPALQGLDPDAPVLLAGSFSKVLFPSLRLGYIVVPPALVPAFTANLSIASRPPLLEQAVLCEFIKEGHFARHLRRMREIYAERFAVLNDAVRQNLDGMLELSSIEAGLQTVGWLCGNSDGESVARAAAERGVEVIPLSRYFRGRASREGLQLGFAAVEGPEIRRGVAELALVLEKTFNAARQGQTP